MSLVCCCPCVVVLVVARDRCGGVSGLHVAGALVACAYIGSVWDGHLPLQYTRCGGESSVSEYEIVVCVVERERVGLDATPVAGSHSRRLIGDVGIAGTCRHRSGGWGQPQGISRNRRAGSGIGSESQTKSNGIGYGHRHRNRNKHRNTHIHIHIHRDRDRDRA